MVDYREILRLNSLGNSQRQIEETVHSGHHTVSDTLAAARENGIAWPLDESMTNEKLQAILFPGKFQQRPQYLEPDYAYIHRELAKPGVTLALLWEEYCTKAKSVGAQPYMTTQFREKYHIWARVQNATMRLKHKPGDVMEVDWAGNTIPIYDPDTGAEDEAYLFVAVLPFSAYAYVEACADMKSECWIRCHMHAYEYFGGVTRLLVPDNLKTGVITNTRYDTVLNKSYREMAEHYWTAIVPTRVRHPKDKPYAEGAVKRTYQKILAPLRNRKFFSVHEANEAVAVQLEVLNTTPFQKREGCRKSAFEQDEKEFLRPLPTMQYEPATWLKAKVPTDYLISDGKNKYSVPFDLIGEEVDIRLTKSNVEVFFKGSRVASHVRVLRAMRDPIIFEEHMTPEHRKYLRYSADDFRVWAKSVGRKTENVIEYLLTSKREPEQAYKECAALSRLCDRYGAERLEDACDRMLSISSGPSVRNIASLLKSRRDSKASAKDAEKRETGGGITRGAAAFAIGGAKK